MGLCVLAGDGSGFVLDRWECVGLRGWRGSWLVVYGRRWVGKSWLVRRCVGWDYYVVLGRSGFCSVFDKICPFYVIYLLFLLYGKILKL